jgi:hypothetical protein
MDDFLGWIDRARRAVNENGVPNCCERSRLMTLALARIIGMYDRYERATSDYWMDEMWEALDESITAAVQLYAAFPSE